MLVAQSGRPRCIEFCRNLLLLDHQFDGSATTSSTHEVM